MKGFPFVQWDIVTVKNGEETALSHHKHLTELKPFTLGSQFVACNSKLVFMAS